MMVDRAQEWFDQLTAYLDAHGLIGYDPFDIKEHPLVSWAQSYKWPRRSATALSDVFPLTTRRLLRIKKSENPKAFALVALASLRQYSLTESEEVLNRGERHLRWLLRNTSKSNSGLCWGYPFTVRGKGLTITAGTPIGVVCSIAGDAFALAHELTGTEIYANAVDSIATHLLMEMPRMYLPDETFCFGYTPGDKRRVHNANLHVVEHLYRAHRLTNRTHYLNAARPALEFTLRAQRADGAWPYGAWSPEEPYEKSLMDIVDHHHTGFVLRSLNAIHRMEGEPRLWAALEKGYRFYSGNLFTNEGIPINAFGMYPIDIHACAEGILCNSVLSSLFASAGEVATSCLDWSWKNMRNPKSGMPYYRRYPWFTSKLLCPRWGLGWMYLALSEYLVAARRNRNFPSQLSYNPR